MASIAKKEIPLGIKIISVLDFIVFGIMLLTIYPLGELGLLRYVLGGGPWQTALLFIGGNFSFFVLIALIGVLFLISGISMLRGENLGRVMQFIMIYVLGIWQIGGLILGLVRGAMFGYSYMPEGIVFSLIPPAIIVWIVIYLYKNEKVKEFFDK